MAGDNNMFGSIDANKGDYQNGWILTNSPTNVYEVTEAMLEVIQVGGFSTGGINFERNSDVTLPIWRTVYRPYFRMDTFAHS
jgi:xylose isomerase